MLIAIGIILLSLLKRMKEEEAKAETVDTRVISD
jgi:hypothetical protein